MRGQQRLLVVLAAVCVLCVGIYFLLRTQNERAAEQAESNITIAALPDVQTLSFTNQYGTFSFTRTDGGWSYDGDPDFKPDNASLDMLAEYLADLRAIRALEEPDELSGYGLDNPAMRLTATAGQDTFTLLIGSAAGGNYYAKLEGIQTVYTISPDLPRAVNVPLSDLEAVPETDAATETPSAG